MKILLEEGANPSSADKDDESCLHNSVDIGSIENTRLLLEAGAQLEARNVSDETPLLAAARSFTSAHRDIMELLLDHGANADARFKSGGSCFHKAVANSDVTKVRMLLKREANMEARDSEGDSVLHYAARYMLTRYMYTSKYVLESLLTKHKVQGTLQTALEARNNDGCTVLHVAASSGSHLAVAVKILVEYGASVEAKDKDGETPLHAAIRFVRDSGRFIIFDIPKGGIKEAVVNADVCQKIVTLLDAGADPLAMNDLGVTPMAAAIGAPQFEALHGMKSWHVEQKALMLDFASAAWFNAREEAGDSRSVDGADLSE